MGIGSDRYCVPKCGRDGPVPGGTMPKVQAVQLCGCTFEHSQKLLYLLSLTHLRDSSIPKSALYKDDGITIHHEHPEK